MPESVLQFPSTTSTAALVDQAAILKEELAEKTEALRKINLILAERGEFKPGSKTGRVCGNHFVAKVQLKENVKWDQSLLADAREVMGDAEFFKVFKWTFEPISAKTISGALEFGRHAELIAAARSVSPGSPYVTFEKQESC